VVIAFACVWMVVLFAVLFVGDDFCGLLLGLLCLFDSSGVLCLGFVLFDWCLGLRYLVICSWLGFECDIALVC